MLSSSTKTRLLRSLLSPSPPWTCLSCRAQLVKPRDVQRGLNEHQARTIASQTQHYDLSTFLDYASRTGLSQGSTTYVGTRYEYIALHALARLGFALVRTGGRDDAGVDLVGVWLLPPPRLKTPGVDDDAASTPEVDAGKGTPLSSAEEGEVTRIKALIQCKALSNKPGPNHIRELEGAFTAAPRLFRGLIPSFNQNTRESNLKSGPKSEPRSSAEPGSNAASTPNSDPRSSLESGSKQESPTKTPSKTKSSKSISETQEPVDEARYGPSTTPQSQNTIAFLVTKHTATKGVRDALSRSRLPMGYAKLNDAGRMEQLVWNRAAADCGLLGLRIDTRYLPGIVNPQNEAVEGQGKNEVVEGQAKEDIEEQKRLALAAEVVVLWGEREWAWSETEVRRAAGL